jgi:hypothetical protein
MISPASPGPQPHSVASRYTGADDAGGAKIDSRRIKQAAQES